MFRLNETFFHLKGINQKTITDLDLNNLSYCEKEVKTKNFCYS